jgi:hypothetical protein
LPHSRRFPRPCKIKLTIGKPITFTDTSNNREGWETVAKAAESAVRDLATPESAA